MATTTFTRQVSKGTRFNQIYIPKEMNELFQVGDTVEVKLISKVRTTHIKKALLKDIRKIFAEQILKFFSDKNIDIIIFGSFVKSEEFKDIDLIVASDISSNLEQEITKNFGSIFHIIKIPKDKIQSLYEKCPITRLMLESFISNFDLKLKETKRIDKNYIEYLLMMPEDILEFELNSRIYFDNIRRVFTIEYFLKNKKATSERIIKDMEKIMGKELLLRMRKNEDISHSEYEKSKKIIKDKLKSIRSILNVKEARN